MTRRINKRPRSVGRGVPHYASKNFPVQPSPINPPAPLYPREENQRAFRTAWLRDALAKFDQNWKEGDHFTNMRMSGRVVGRERVGYRWRVVVQWDGEFEFAQPGRRRPKYIKLADFIRYAKKVEN
jgi:hypothetical protein